LPLRLLLAWLRRRLASGEVLFYAGRFEDAGSCLEAAILRLANAEPTPFTTQALLHGRVYLVAVGAELGELDAAEDSVVAAEQLIRDVRQGEHHPNGVFLHVVRGKLLALRGNLAAAELSLAHAEEFHRRTGWPLDQGYTLIQLAGVRRRLRRHAEARALARHARQVIAACPDPGMLRELLARLERSLQLSVDPASERPLPVEAELSERELTILRLLASKLSQREIGSELYISLNTVKGHVRNIFRKLGVSTRTDAVERGRALDLI
jgi:LuxR family maltose regulon positive regulatory protein